MDTKQTVDGRTWISCDVLVVGDYGGAGSVGAANIRVLNEQHKGTLEQIAMSDWERGDQLTRGADGHSSWVPVNPDRDTTVVETYGSYSSVQIWLLDTPDARETLAALEDYPAIDDEAISEIELEWENEAWTNYVRADLLCAIRKSDETLADAIDDDRFTNDELFTAYREAMESTNTYPTAEYSSVYIDIDRIVGAYASRLRELL